REDEQGVRASQSLVEDLIKEQKAKGVAAGRIVLAGFSQGGAIVLQTALRYPERLAGVMALSCYLPIASTVEGEARAENKDVPIFMAPGQYDDVIAIGRAQKSREHLAKLGYAIEWHEYP